MATAKRQELFNKAYIGLANQAFERSSRPKIDGGGCAYRGAFGRKCAIGHLIPDQKYDPAYDALITENAWKQIIVNFGWRKHESFLSELQNCHDKAESPEDMRAALTAFAGKYQLGIPEEAL